MATNWDLQKPAQPTVKKTVASANIRSRRMGVKPEHENYNKNICAECGFRIRSKNHVNGAHHNGNVPRCSRG